MTGPGPQTRVLPQLHGTKFVTDGGMETDLIFHHGVDLPDFAAFPLLDTADGRGLLTHYYDGYATIARQASAGLMLEAPTWRANPDWGTRLGYRAADLARVNTAAITLLAGLRERYTATLGIGTVLVSGMVGPRGDGYGAGRPDPDEAAGYHGPQLKAFAAAGADLATALTLTDIPEAIGIVRAARAVGLPIAISFTVETDGRLPGGPTIADAITTVDATAAPDYYLINCAHPTHIRAGLSRPGTRSQPGTRGQPGTRSQPGPWIDRIVGIRANASLKSHAELDDAEYLDEGDIGTFAAAQAGLTAALPALTILGGCCGTDHRHVAALWGTSG
jgi:homocysteine S-methyltransferase